MTIIQCDVRDSLGNPIAGFIRITLDYWLADGVQSYLEVPAQVSLTGGLATLNLEPSEFAKVTYLFEIFQTGTPPVLLRSFRALVPDRTTAINLNELAQTTGITRDAQASAIGAVTRRLYTLPDFWNAARNNLFPQKGSFSATAFYQPGDIVLWNGSTYICVSGVAIQGIFPSDTSVWQLWAAKGDTGTGTAGNPTPYNATSWAGATDAPSRGVIRDLVETQLARTTELNLKADLSNPVLTAPRLAADPPTFNSSNLIPSTQWVQNLVFLISRAQTPIGSIIAYGGSAAPAFWLLCDGRTVSRTTYADLFAILGTAYGAGNGTTTFTLPDFRGRVLVSPDNSAVQGSANRIPGATVGSSGGNPVTTILANNLPAHTHAALGTAGSFWTQVASGGTQNLSFTAGTTANTFTTTGNNTTTNDPISILQPYQVANYCIFAGA